MGFSFDAPATNINRGVLTTSTPTGVNPLACQFKAGFGLEFIDQEAGGGSFPASNGTDQYQKVVIAFLEQPIFDYGFVGMVLTVEKFNFGSAQLFQIPGRNVLAGNVFIPRLEVFKANTVINKG